MTPSAEVGGILLAGTLWEVVFGEKASPGGRRWLKASEEIVSSLQKA